MFKSKAPDASNTTIKTATLIDLPAELIRHIAGYLPFRDKVELAGTNLRLHFLLRDAVKEERPAAQLMDYVLKPTEENVKKAKAMIAANSSIMFIKTNGVEWASGVKETEKTLGDSTKRKVYRAVHRVCKGSPFQAALGTGDSDIYNFMAQHFDKVVYKDNDGEVIETGIQEAQRQIQERFPNGFEYPAVETAFTELMNKIVNAITVDESLKTNNTPSPATQAVLNEFRHYFLPKEVTQGHHFNLNYLIEAFNRYNQNWDPWNGNQLSLFWREVIGYLERLVPAFDAQAFCQGLYYRVEQNQPPTRSLTLHNYQSSSDISYFPAISFPPTTGLGFDFAIYAGRRGAWGERVRMAGSCGSYLKNYVEQKHQSLTSLNNTLNSGLTRQPKSRETLCAIL